MIFTAASTYVWENVYAYDREFRMHIANYPDRSWAIILQQAWSMCLKDKLSHSGNSFGRNGGVQGKNKKENCRCFNKGLCTAGRNCRYEHQCNGCGKFGHGIHICRNRTNTAGASGSSMTTNPAGGSSSDNQK